MRALALPPPRTGASSGVIDLAKGYQKEKGVKVDIQVQGMGGMLAQAKATTPPADIIFLPPNLMDQLEADKGIVPGSRVPLGRVRMAVAVHKGDPVPDISTVAKLAAVLKSADSVMRSNPAGGSMVAAIIEKMLQRPEFAGVKSRISTNGEGGEAVARGEGQMAIQAECEILNHPRPTDRCGTRARRAWRLYGRGRGGVEPFDPSQGSRGLDQIRHPARHLFALAGARP